MNRGFGAADMIALIALLLVIWLAATQQFSSYASKQTTTASPVVAPSLAAEPSPSPAAEAPAGSP